MGFILPSDIRLNQDLGQTEREATEHVIDALLSVREVLIEGNDWPNKQTARDIMDDAIALLRLHQPNDM